MKKCCLIAVAILYALNTFADAYLSPMANIHYSGFSQYNAASRNIHYDPRWGLKAGLAADSALNDVFLLQVGIFLTMKGDRMKNTTVTIAKGNLSISTILNYLTTSGTGI
jgi:hypothetical protein